MPPKRQNLQINYGNNGKKNNLDSNPILPKQAIYQRSPTRLPIFNATLDSKSLKEQDVLSPTLQVTQNQEFLSQASESNRTLNSTSKIENSLSDQSKSVDCATKPSFRGLFSKYKEQDVLSPTLQVTQNQEFLSQASESNRTLNSTVQIENSLSDQSKSVDCAPKLSFRDALFSNSKKTATANSKGTQLPAVVTDGNTNTLSNLDSNKLTNHLNNAMESVKADPPSPPSFTKRIERVVRISNPSSNTNKKTASVKSDITGYPQNTPQSTINVKPTPLINKGIIPKGRGRGRGRGITIQSSSLSNTKNSPSPDTNHVVNVTSTENQPSSINNRRPSVTNLGTGNCRIDRRGDQYPPKSTINVKLSPPENQGAVSHGIERGVPSVSSSSNTNNSTVSVRNCVTGDCRHERGDHQNSPQSTIHYTSSPTINQGVNYQGIGGGVQSFSPSSNTNNSAVSVTNRVTGNCGNERGDPRSVSPSSNTNNRALPVTTRVASPCDLDFNSWNLYHHWSRTQKNFVSEEFDSCASSVSPESSQGQPIKSKKTSGSRSHHIPILGESRDDSSEYLSDSRGEENKQLVNNKPEKVNIFKRNGDRRQVLEERFMPNQVSSRVRKDIYPKMSVSHPPSSPKAKSVPQPGLFVTQASVSLPLTEVSEQSQLSRKKESKDAIEVNVMVRAKKMEEGISNKKLTTCDKSQIVHDLLNELSELSDQVNELTITNITQQRQTFLRKIGHCTEKLLVLSKELLPSDGSNPSNAKQQAQLQSSVSGPTFYEDIQLLTCEELDDEIEDILAELERLKHQVENFTGTYDDKQYKYLERRLHMCTGRLDEVDTSGRDDNRLRRRNTATQITSTLNLLKSKVFK